MLLRPTSTLALLLLAACQGAPHMVDTHEVNASPLDSHGNWRTPANYTPVEIMDELRGVRQLLAARAMAATTLESADVGSTVTSPDTLEWMAEIARLNGRVNRLHAALAASGGTSTVDASHSIGETLTPDAAATEAESEALAEGAIKTLRDSLVVLAREHALHCENIANSNVHGYKRRSLSVGWGMTDPSGLRVPEVGGTRLMMLQGVLELTGNELDFGIEGEGFFEVQLPDGSRRYTRGGAFRQSFAGRLVTPEGYLLTDQIMIPPDAQGLAVSRDGQVFSLQEENGLRAIGTIRLHVFASPTELKPVGSHAFEPTASSGQPQARQPDIAGTGHLLQGYLERSNVEVTDELIRLQLVERRAAAVRRSLASYGIYAR